MLLKVAKTFERDFRFNVLTSSTQIDGVQVAMILSLAGKTRTIELDDRWAERESFRAYPCVSEIGGLWHTVVLCVLCDEVYQLTTHLLT